MQTKVKMITDKFEVSKIEDNKFRFIGMLKRLMMEPPERMVLTYSRNPSSFMS